MRIWIPVLFCAFIAVPSSGQNSTTNNEPYSLKLVTSDKVSPFSKKRVSVELTNNSDKPLEIWSNMEGIISFLDVKVRDAEGNRISKEFYRSSISSPFAKATLHETVPAGKSKLIPKMIFEGIESDIIKPGKYKCSVRLKYNNQKIDISSGEIEIEVSKDDIANRKQ